MALFKLNFDTIVILGGLGAVGYYLYTNGYPPFGTNEFKLDFLDQIFKKKTDDNAEDNTDDTSTTAIPEVQTGGTVPGQLPAISYNPNPPAQQTQQYPNYQPQNPPASGIEDDFYNAIYQSQINQGGQIYPPYYDYNTTGPVMAGDTPFSQIPNYQQYFPSTASTASITLSSNSVEKGKSISVQCNGFAANEVINFVAFIGSATISTDHKSAGADGSVKLDTLTISSTSPLGQATVYAVGATSGRNAMVKFNVIAVANHVFLQTRLPNDVAEVIDPNHNRDDMMRYLKSIKYKQSSRSSIIHASRHVAGG